MSYTPTHRAGRTYGRNALVLVAIVGALVGLYLSPGRAYAGQVEPADRDVTRRAVTYVERYAPGRFFVELNNGAAFTMRRCNGERMTCWRPVPAVAIIRGHRVEVADR